MPLRRYQSQDQARQDLLDLCIAESAEPFHRNRGLENVPSWGGHLKHRVKGVFRFKSWEEAHRFDLDLLIEESCASEKMDEA